MVSTDTIARTACKTYCTNHARATDGAGRCQRWRASTQPAWRIAYESETLTLIFLLFPFVDLEKKMKMKKNKQQDNSISTHARSYNIYIHCRERTRLKS